MKITTHYISDYLYESENESGNRLRMDMLSAEDKAYFSPMQLVLSAVGGCAAVDLIQMLKKRRRTVLSLRMETEGRRRDSTPKKFEHIHIRFVLSSPDTEYDEFGKLITLAVEKYCSVSASLEPNVSIDYSWVIERPEETENASGSSFEE